MAPHQPSWFRSDATLILNAATCGLNKDGVEQYVVDPATGQRTQEIDDQLATLTRHVVAGSFLDDHVAYVNTNELRSKHIAVPHYYDNTSRKAFAQLISRRSRDFEARSIASLMEAGDLSIIRGHGSPSSDQRVGDIPYIKVSDLRAGQVNVNPSNLIPRPLANKLWKADHSGLRPYDLISPERASKNIGEFCVLMPGQEEIVLTREVLILRGMTTRLSQFFLMWALSLEVVRDQWARVVFMQTNREDVGNRYLEIEIPVPRTDAVARRCAEPFEKYFRALSDAKLRLRDSLGDQGEAFHLFYA